MTRDYMMTVIRKDGSARDIQVNNATSIHEAIQVAEDTTGCRVDHGRSGIGSDWHPAVIVDAGNGSVYREHDRAALDSMTIATPNKHRLFE